MSTAYNLKIRQTTEAVRSVTASGTDQIKFRGEVMIRGQLRTRTVVAQGKAAALIDSMVGEGNELSLRGLFDRAPANEEGTRGGEFISVVGIPRAKAA